MPEQRKASGFGPEDAGGNVAPDFGAQLVAILVVYRRRAHGHGLVAPVTFNTGISQGRGPASFCGPPRSPETLPKTPYPLPPPRHPPPHNLPPNQTPPGPC